MRKADLEGGESRLAKQREADFRIRGRWEVDLRGQREAHLKIGKRQTEARERERLGVQGEEHLESWER